MMVIRRIRSRRWGRKKEENKEGRREKEGGKWEEKGEGEGREEEEEKEGKEEEEEEEHFSGFFINNFTINKHNLIRLTLLPFSPLRLLAAT